MHALIRRLVASSGVDRAAADRAVDDVASMNSVRETARKQAVGDPVCAIPGLGPSV